MVLECVGIAKVGLIKNISLRRIAIQPSRTQSGRSEINIGDARVWYSKYIGGVRQSFIKWHKHKVSRPMWRDQPASIFTFMCEIHQLLPDVGRSQLLEKHVGHPH